MAWAAASARSRRSAITVALRSRSRVRPSAPVRLTLTRPEEQVDSGNRPATDQRIRIGARRDGTLTAISVESHGTAGVGLDAGVGNFAQALYDCPNFESAQYDVFTNAGPGSAMRGPAIRPAPGAWRRRSTSSPSARRSIRSRCASASIRARCGAKSGESARRGSAGRAATRRAPIPARSSAASAWRNRSGARMCRPLRRSRCESIATDRSRRCRAFRTSVRELAW